MIECSICKSPNDDRSLYCLECGQRLTPQSQSTSQDVTTGDMLATPKRGDIPVRPNTKLHSPILDLGGRMARNGIEEFVEIEENFSSGPSNNMSRHGLHSPLLDGQSHSISNRFSSSTNITSYTKTSATHLHSPVLDGPTETLDVYTDNIPDEDYNSLRSPLLSAKISLPEHPELETMSPASTVTQEFPPISITGLDKANKATQQSKTSQSVRVSSTRLKAENKPSFAGLERSILPTRPPLTTGMDEGKYSSGNALGGVIVILVLAELGLKAWYLLSLGNSIFSSTPFLFDQIGQILLALAMLLFIATAKS